jgi:hypothetical protein
MYIFAVPESAVLNTCVLLDPKALHRLLHRFNTSMLTGIVAAADTTEHKGASAISHALLELQNKYAEISILDQA